jgi:hypothetical protein
MKPTTATLYFGSSLILALVVIALAIATPNIIFSGSNNATPTNTITPTPAATTTPTMAPTANYTYKYPLTFTYDYQKTDLNNSQTEVGYIITAAYHKDTPLTINYSDFYLKLSYQNGINTMDAGTVSLQNNGTLTLDPSHTTETFELSFQFPTYSFNGAEQAATHFTLQYSGQAKLFGD